MKADEIRSLIRAGAVGEIAAWAFDARGQLIEGLTNDRVTSVPLHQPARRRIIGVCTAPNRLKAVRGALAGKLVNGFITNELMAASLLQK